MNSESENSMNKGDHSESASKSSNPSNPAKKQFNTSDGSGDMSIDSQRQPEGQGANFKDYSKKDNKESADKFGGQQNQKSDKKPLEAQSDRVKSGANANQAKLDKNAWTDDKEDIDSGSHPEEQVGNPKEYKKMDGKEYSNKAERN